MSPIISNSAKLMNIQGSQELRSQAAAVFRMKFSKMLADTFEKKTVIERDPALTLDDIRSIYKKLIPNIDIEVKSAKGGCLDSVLNADSGKIVGFKMNLKCISGQFIHRWDYSKIATLGHENAHLATAITNPKAWMKESMYYSQKQFRESQDFYSHILYADEIAGLDPTMKNVLKQNIPQRVEALKNRIFAFFNSIDASPNEKIQLLQSWRYGLKDEVLAFKVGALSWAENKYQSFELIKKLMKKENVLVQEIDENTGKILSQYDSSKYNGVNSKITGLKNFIKMVAEKQANRDIKDGFMFPEKLELLEKMLADEITSARKALRSKLGNKN